MSSEQQRAGDDIQKRIDKASERRLQFEQKLLEQVLEMGPSISCIIDEAFYEATNILPPNPILSDPPHPYKEGSLGWFLRQPADTLTPEILIAASHETRHFCRQNNVNFTEDYQELVYRLTEKNIRVLEDIHGSFATDAMAAKYILSQPNDSETQKLRWGQILTKPFFRPGPLFVNSVILRKINVISGLGRPSLEMIRDEVLTARLLDVRSNSGRLVGANFNKPNVIINLVKGGWFPPKEELPMHLGVQEDMGLDVLLYGHSKRQGVAQDYIRSVCEGLIKRHPIEQVVAQANTPSKKQSLVLLYTKAELLPLVMQDNFTKGLLLDDALGL